MPFQAVTMVSGHSVADAMGIMDTVLNTIIPPGVFSTSVFIMAKGFDAAHRALPLEAASIDGAGPLRTFSIGAPLGACAGHPGGGTGFQRETPLNSL